MKILFFLLLTIFNLIFDANFVQAIEAPNFPSCNNPSGVVKISYNEGTHGIVGDGATYTGKDTVYQLDNGNLQQCFCAVDGRGIQTNWWKDGSIDQQQRQILINAGWKYVPNGALWGLQDGVYYAKNSSYNCDSDTSSGTSGNEITNQAVVGEVLGLDNTDNSLLLLTLILGAIGFFLIGNFFYKKVKFIE